MAQLGALPRWDMTSVFPALESVEFTGAFEVAKGEIGALGALFEARGIRRRESAAVDVEVVQAFEEATARLNGIYQQVRTLRSYIGAFVTTDAGNDTAQALLSELQMASVPLEQLQTRYTAWVGSLDIAALLEASATAREHEYVLRKASVLAAHQMAEGEEELAADLQPVGLGGWAKLHDNVTALLTVPLTVGGEERTLPMSALRALATDPDRAIRRTAYEAELLAWEGVAVPLAAALNGVKGYQRTLRQRRQYADDVEPTLLANSIDCETLAAMQQACVESFPDFRRYLQAKARALGVERLAWFDLNAPVGEEHRGYTWPEAEAFIREQFGRYSPRMAAFAERSFRERWIDAEPRAGKQGGGFCMTVRPGESRILMNYDGSFYGISTLAHELGHAYHNLNLERRTPLQSRTPSTLAETASIFCETLGFDAALAHASGGERLALLEAALQRNLLTVVDIHSRFLFEQAVFERRAQRELTAREFDALMLDAQRQTYGDGLDGGYLHPKMWAVKGHYYGPTFYNYPYTFGLLFGLGLYARYTADPDAFRASYDELLSSTGLADAATLARRFQFDVRGTDFWRSSLDVIRGQIAEFERLVGGAGVSMQIETFNVGPMDNNAYLIIDDETKHAALVDPSFESEPILDILRGGNLQLDWILNTHGHYDHIVNNAYFKRETGAPLAIHAGDLPLLENMRGQAAWMGIEHGEDSPPPDRLLEEGDTVEVGSLRLRVLHTPGHSPGGITFLAEETAIVGDALFAGSIGRYDLPGADGATLLRAIRTKLLTLPDETRVLPGHGPATTIGAEKRGNPYLT